MSREGRGDNGRVDHPEDGKKRRSWKKWLFAALGGGLLLLIGGVVVMYTLTDVPAPNKLATAQATTITFSDGSEMARIGAQNRILVTIDQISDPAQKAVLAAEDRSFYSEPGISPKGIFRALLTNLKGGGSVQQGGSTITQQYAKNAFLTSERTYTRKLKEVFIAVKLSRTQTKGQILEDYLNTIYFGRGANGIEAAARQYFGVSAKDLTVAQAAVLASSIRSPSGYDPQRYPAKALDRWNYVLDGMVKKGWLSAADRSAAVYPSVLAISAGPASNDLSGAKGYIVSKVEDEIDQNATLKDLMVAGGLTIETTIDKTAQAAAVAAVNAAVPLAKTQADRVGALVSIQPGDGAVRAYVGGQTGNRGTDYAGGATFLRQPGSSFKPYALAAALAKGRPLSTMLDGSTPQQICGQPMSNDEGDPPLGQTDLVRAMQLSVNTVYFRLACELGPKNVADLAHAAGIPGSVQLLDVKKGVVGAGIALGIYEVHVIDQAAGYATFAAGGQAAKPYFIEQVTSSGEKVYQARPVVSQAFSHDVAVDATTAMQAVVVAPGTGTKAQLDGRPTAGKTGTTTNNVDAWFCGFTPQLATAVWVGRPDQGSLRVPGVSGGISGGAISAGIFKAYMDAALVGKPVMAFPLRSDASPTVPPSPSAASPSPLASRTPSVRPSASASPARPSARPSDTPSLLPAPTTLPSDPSPTPSGVVSPPPSSPVAQAPRADRAPMSPPASAPSDPAPSDPAQPSTVPETSASSAPDSSPDPATD